MRIAAPAPVRWGLLPRVSKSMVWSVLLALLFLAMLAFAIFKPILVLPRMALAPGFLLTDQAGARLTNEDLRGRIVLYNFTYTHCAAPCPETGAVMNAVQAQLPNMATQGLPVTLVTLSFDPDRDSAAQLRRYAERFGADPALWRLATGEAMPLKYIIGGGFGVYYQANSAPEAKGAFTFDPTFVLVDGAGIVRAKYRTATPDLAILQRDIELVAKEAAASTGAGRLVYEAAHLFVCYPK
ncbi:MAG: SCO family protein [Caldilinea sp. CFX5]|nr:SCO family protein [Caldilinea sp. CFX5]